MTALVGVEERRAVSIVVEVAHVDETVLLAATHNNRSISKFIHRAYKKITDIMLNIRA